MTTVLGYLGSYLLLALNWGLALVLEQVLHSTNR